MLMCACSGVYAEHTECVLVSGPQTCPDVVEVPGECQLDAQCVYERTSVWRLEERLAAYDAGTDAAPVGAPTIADAAPDAAPVITLGAPLYFDGLGSRPDPIRFAVDGYDYGLLGPSIELAEARWEAATCIPLIEAYGQNVVQYGDHSNMTPGRVGQTTGEWEHAVIRVIETVPGAINVIVAHEMGHVLGRTNNHSLTGLMAASDSHDVVINQDTLDLVCASGACRCERPEQ